MTTFPTIATPAPLSSQRTLRLSDAARCRAGYKSGAFRQVRAVAHAVAEATTSDVEAVTNWLMFKARIPGPMTAAELAEQWRTQMATSPSLSCSGCGQPTTNNHAHTESVLCKTCNAQALEEARNTLVRVLMPELSRGE